MSVVVVVTAFPLPGHRAEVIAAFEEAIVRVHHEPGVELYALPLTETVESGNGSHPNGMVEQITGTPPRTFRDFARKNAAAWSEAAT